MSVVTLLPYILSFLSPHVIAILNDPRGNRRWLRVIVFMLVVAAAAAIQTLQSGAWSWAIYVQSIGTIGTGSTVFFTLFRNVWLGQMEVKSGNGLGSIIDMLKPGFSSSDTGSQKLAEFQRLKAELDTYLAATVINQEEYNAQLAAARQTILGVDPVKFTGA